MRASPFTLLALVATCTLAACGGGSSNVRIPGSPPTGSFTTYTGSGFSVSVPSGWTRTSVGPTADGRTISIWNAPGSGSARVEIDYFAHPSHTGTTIGALIDSIKTSEKYVGANLQLSSLRVTGASVPGAFAAKLITELGTSTNGPHLRKELLVRTRAGTLIDFSATRFAGSTAFAPLAVINSFRLTGAA